MKVTKQVFCVALIALVAFACKNTKYKKTKDGFPYKVYSEGKGEKIMPGNVIRYHTTSRLGDSLLGTTHGQPAQWLPIPKDGPGMDMVQFFLDARKGDSILLLQPIDSIMAKNPMAAKDSLLLANKGKSIETMIKIVEVYKDQEAANGIREKEQMDTYFKEPAMAVQKTKDEAEINAYIKTNNITAAKRSPWGVYIQTLTPGNGQKGKLGDFVMLRYKGKFLNGEEFDSNTKPGDPVMPLQLGAGGAIIGFEDGVKQLSKGEKAMLIIPSVIGYGQQGSPPKIAPNQNLLFEIEVIDISDKAPPPPTMPMPDTTRK